MEQIPWLWLGLVHVIVRFLLQPVGFPRASSGPLGVVFRLFVTLVLAQIAFLRPSILPLLLVYAILHTIIDEICRWAEGRNGKHGFELLIVSELVQWYLIFRVGGGVMGTGIEPRGLLTIGSFLLPRTLPPFGVDHLRRFLVLITGYLFALRGGTEVVRRMLDIFPDLEPPQDELPGIGRAIGNLERLLLTTFVLWGQYAALGFVIAAKSIARFKELDKRHFAEYYLVGTLASAGVTVAVGLAMRTLLNIR
jgi:hypothetical protein